MVVRAGARAAARAHAHALGVVPAAGRVAGCGARARGYAVGAARPRARAARAPPPAGSARVRGGGSPREHRSLRACRLPRIFVLTSRTGTVKLCSFASVRRGLTAVAEALLAPIAKLHIGYISFVSLVLVKDP